MLTVVNNCTRIADYRNTYYPYTSPPYLQTCNTQNLFPTVSAPSNTLFQFHDKQVGDLCTINIFPPRVLVPLALFISVVVLR